MNKLILKNIDELVTCKGSAPKCGVQMNKVGIIKNGFVVIHDDLIKDVGIDFELVDEYDVDDYTVINCKGKAVIPGFVDSHTHFVFGGYRANEFSARLKGASYMDILKKGGGIFSTVKSTRESSLDELIEIGMNRLDAMLAYGVTTVEAKSGYGLDLATELKQLRAIKELNKRHIMDVVPTFLGPHSVPKEYSCDADGFIDYMIEDILPVVKEERLAEFADIFCEKSVFDIKQSKRFLLAAKEHGLKLKIHADEIVQLGGAELAAKLGAVSADHLLNVSDKGIEDMGTKGVIATLLPATAFCLKENYADARKIIDRGCGVALATDFNPGSSFTNSIPFVIALAALNMNMSAEEIVTALTINGAAAVSRASKVGSIEVGKMADILILDYPSIDFLAYHTGVNIVKTVIKSGKIAMSR